MTKVEVWVDRLVEGSVFISRYRLMSPTKTANSTEALSLPPRKSSTIKWVLIFSFGVEKFLHIAMMCERRVNIGSCCVAHVSSRREAAERLADQRRLMCVHPRGHRISDYGHTELWDYPTPLHTSPHQSSKPSFLLPLYDACCIILSNSFTETFCIINIQIE